MSPGTRGVRGFVVLLFATLTACSGAPRRDSPPAESSPAESSEAPHLGQSQPAVKMSGSGGFDAVTRQKLSDDEFLSAIADLEPASGVKEAGADLAAGRKQILGIPRSNGPSRLPGVHLAREQLPADVKIMKVGGFIEGTTNRYAARFGLLAEKYATEYNETVVRSVTR
jgi:hypothetical protein